MSKEFDISKDHNKNHFNINNGLEVYHHVKYEIFTTEDEQIKGRYGTDKYVTIYGSCVLCVIDNLQDRVESLLELNTKLTLENRDSWLKSIQEEAKQWVDKNFIEKRKLKFDEKLHWVEPFIGMIEEQGELAHALLKQLQGIRGVFSEHEEKAKDAVGDIVIYLLDLCSRRGWDLQEVISDTWNKVVKKRDWNENKVDGTSKNTVV